MNKRPRFAELDYLRGLMALAVMIFHFDKWLTGEWVANTLPGRLGVYAVSIFFVLSGLALTLAYEHRMNEKVSSWAPYFAQRFRRIYPLLWLATFATLLLDDVRRPFSTILLNITGLFGFINPADDIATGAWSIGCELVYYCLFPFLLLLSQGSKPGFFAGLFAALSMGGWLAFYGIPADAAEQRQWWPPYTAAANHACFFISGMAMGRFRAYGACIPSSIWRLILALGVLAFVFWPLGPDPLQLVCGTNRIILSLLSILICWAVFNSRLAGSTRIHRGLGWLGSVSYSLYLLHPLVFRGMRAVFNRLQIAESYWLLMGAAAATALVFSHFVYHYFERRLLR